MIAPKLGVTFREMVCGDHFYYGAEVVATRGFPSPGSPNPLAETAGALGPLTIKARKTTNGN